MATDLMMPALSPTMEKGTLARWLIAVGDAVKPGDLLAEIETDKATMEFEAIDEGVISEIVVQEGTDDVPVGAIIARIGESALVSPSTEKILSPSARRTAKSTGRDPASIDGTGRRGLVTKDDVFSARAPVVSQGRLSDVKMPALSPTMEKGTIARWLVAVGDRLNLGDLIAEIETDKATMELEAVEEGILSEILYPAGSEDIAVETVIARVSNGARADAPPAVSAAPAPPAAPGGGEVAQKQPSASAKPEGTARPPYAVGKSDINVLSPLLRRIAEARSVDLASMTGSGPNGRIVLADLMLGQALAVSADRVDQLPDRAASAPAQAVSPPATPDIPHDLTRLSGMRKTIARRLTESKQQVPHIYLTVDVRLDNLLRLRGELNDALAPRGIKLSVNDMIIKAQALALLSTPACNVQHTADTLIRFSRADISVAVSIPDGLITPIIVDAGSKSLSKIATDMKALAARARAGKLQPSEYQGGTASLSNLGMHGIREFAAVINPPQAMILAVGAGEQRVVVDAGDVSIATIMSATGSFDHRAIDGADAASFMGTFRSIVESPLQLLG